MDVLPADVGPWEGKGALRVAVEASTAETLSPRLGCLMVSGSGADGRSFDGRMKEVNVVVEEAGDADDDVVVMVVVEADDDDDDDDDRDAAADDDDDGVEVMLVVVQCCAAIGDEPQSDGGDRSGAGWCRKDLGKWEQGGGRGAPGRTQCERIVCTLRLLQVDHGMTVDSLWEGSRCGRFVFWGMCSERESGFVEM